MFFINTMNPTTKGNNLDAILHYDPNMGIFLQNVKLFCTDHVLYYGERFNQFLTLVPIAGCHARW